MIACNGANTHLRSRQRVLCPRDKPTACHAGRFLEALCGPSYSDARANPYHNAHADSIRGDAIKEGSIL